MNKLNLILILTALPSLAIASDTEYEIFEALANEVSVGFPRSFPIRHCRETAGNGDRWARCNQRLKSFSHYFVTSANEHNVDAWTLAAMALKESGLNPFAEGGVGERGIMQLHPRGVGAHSRFVRNDRFRRRCHREPGACQQEVVDIAAKHLSDWMERCDSEAEALGGYNTGRCQVNRYSIRVRALKAKLQGIEFVVSAEDAS